MNKLKHILVPIDFSDTSGLILKQGARLACWNEATLHVFHAIEGGSLKHFESTHGKQDPALLKSRAQVLMDELIRTADLPAVTIEKNVVTGDPAECIIKQSDEIGADLVVLSAHDTGHERLGSVAARVTRNARCKVLLARDWQTGPFRRIAVCVDFSELSKEALRQAVLVALQEQASLELIHVLYPVERDYYVYKTDFGTESEAEFRARVEKWLEKQIARFTSPLRSELDRLAFTTAILESTSPAITITAHLQSNEFDLVVLGTTGHESAFGLRFGSNAERLIQDTPCSVLAIKEIAQKG